MFIFYDIVSLVLTRPEIDQSTLLSCSLVNSDFHHAASSVLYRRIVLSPTYWIAGDSADNPVSSIPVQTRNHTQVARGLPWISQQYNVLRSSSLPQYAAFVSELVISGAPQQWSKRSSHRLFIFQVSSRLVHHLETTSGHCCQQPYAHTSTFAPSRSFHGSSTLTC